MVILKFERCFPYSPLYMLVQMAKRCTRCLEWKERSEFYRDRSKLDGLKSHCKPCHEQYKREYRTRVRLQALAHFRRTYRYAWQRRTPAIRAVDNAGLRRWQANNLARRRAHITHYLRHWHARNRGTNPGWYQDTPHIPTALRQTHRAEAADAPVNHLSPAEWNWLLDAYDHHCAYCGKTSHQLSPDHVIPLSKGGHNTLGNVVPACRTCNIRKGARTPEQAEMSFIVRVNVDSRLIQLGLI